MTKFYDELRNEAEDIAQNAINGAKQVTPDDLGLDYRCGRLWVGHDFIAVRKTSNGTLRYYGGFEYVDEYHVMEVGDYVFYSSESDRVAGHLEQLKSK